jgi:hypothetical protein
MTYLHDSTPSKLGYVQKNIIGTADQRRTPQRISVPATKEDARSGIPRFRAIPRGEEGMSQRGPPAVNVRPALQLKEPFVTAPNDPEARVRETLSPPTYNDMDELMALQALGLLRSQTSQPPTLHCRSISE